MNPATAEIIIAVMRAAKLGASYLAVANLDEITPEQRAELLAVRDEVNARFDELMPRD